MMVKKIKLKLFLIDKWNCRYINLILKQYLNGPLGNHLYKQRMSSKIMIITSWKIETNVPNKEKNFWIKDLVESNFLYQKDYPTFEKMMVLDLSIIQMKRKTYL